MSNAVVDFADRSCLTSCRSARSPCTRRQRTFVYFDLKRLRVEVAALLLRGSAGHGLIAGLSRELPEPRS